MVDKPAGTLCQGDATGDISLIDQVRAWLVEEFDKPGRAFVGLVHRLDRPVCGVMVLARTSKGASRLSKQFREHTVEKVYHALVHGTPAADRAVLEAELDGKACSLEYRMVRISGATALLEVRPKTGRKHQIRRQLSAIGHPIVGDTRYGAPKRLPNRAIALRAVALSFDHPTRKERLRFEARAPEWWP